MKKLLLAVLAFPLAAHAQAFPTKPIRVVVPFGPGGVADITLRTLAPVLSAGLGQSVVVENKPSAGGIIAGQEVSRAEPDGHTLLLISNGTAVSQALFRSLPYEPENLAMISTIGSFPLVILTDPKSPLKTIRDVLAEAKKNPGKMNAGTIGVGSTQNLSAQLFKATSGADFVIIPYRNTGEVIGAAKNGDAHLIFEIMAPMASHIKSGNLRAIAVTGAKRFAALPDVPTAIESGIAGYDVTSWNGLAAPAKTPRAVIDRINAELAKAVAAAEVKQRFAAMGVEGRTSTPEQLRDFYLSEVQRWTKVVEAAKIPKR